MNTNNSTNTATAAGAVSVATSLGDPHMPAAVPTTMPEETTPSPGRRHQDAETNKEAGPTTTPKLTPTKGKGKKWRDRLDAKKHKQQQQQQQNQRQQQHNQLERENNPVVVVPPLAAPMRATRISLVHEAPSASSYSSSLSNDATIFASTTQTVDLCNSDDTVRTKKNPNNNNNNNNGAAVERNVTNHQNNANGKNTTNQSSSDQDDFYDLVMEEELCFENNNPYEATEDGPRNNTTTKDIPRSSMSSSLPVILESADEYSSSSNSNSNSSSGREKENAATVETVDDGCRAGTMMTANKVRRTTNKKQNKGRAGDKWRNRLAAVHQKRKNHRNNTECSNSPRHTSDCSSPKNFSTTSTRSSCSLNKIVHVSMTEDPGAVSDISEDFTTPPCTRRRSGVPGGALSRGDEPGSEATTTSPRRRTTASSTASEPDVAATPNRTDDAAVTTTTAAVIVIATAAKDDDGNRVDDEANRHTPAGHDTDKLIPRRPGGRSYGSLVQDDEDATTVEQEPEAERRGATTTPSAPKEEASSDEDEDGSRRFYSLVVYPLLIFIVALIVRAIFQMQSII